MIIRNRKDFEALKLIGQIVAKALNKMKSSIEQGITTRELHEIGKIVLDEYGAISAPKSVYGFPGTTCISVNEYVAQYEHSIVITDSEPIILTQI